MAQLLLRLMAAFADFERELIRERVNSGIRSYREAYERGRVGKTRHSLSGKNLPHGRPKRVFDRVRAREMRRKGASIRQIAKELGVSVGTIHSLLKPQA